MYLADQKVVSTEGNVVTLENGDQKIVAERFQPFLLTEEAMTEEEFFEKREKMCVAEMLGVFSDSGAEMSEAFKIADVLKQNLVMAERHAYAKKFGKASSGRVEVRQLFDFLGETE
jgi:DNA-binding SARP family transcriptional activator